MAMKNRDKRRETKLRVSRAPLKGRKSHSAIKRQLRALDVKARKTERIEIRITPSMKALLQRAASVSHKNVTEFLLEAGINTAEETLIDRRMFRLDESQWQAFQDILDRPVTAKPRLAKLLTEKSVLE